MGLTLPEVLKTTRNPFMAMLTKAIVTDDELAAAVQFEQVEGTSFDYVREKALPTFGAWIPDTGITTEESSATVDRVNVQLRRIVGNVDVDTFAALLASTEIDQEAMQVAKKAKAAFREISRTMIYGGYTTGHTFPNAAAGIGLAVTAIVYGPGADSTRLGPASVKYVHAGQFWSYRAPGDLTFGAPVAITTSGSYTLRSDNVNKWIRVTVTTGSISANDESSLYFTSSSNEPDGLNKLMEPSQILASSGANGDSLTFALLDRMIHACKIRENLAFVFTSTMVEKFGALVRAMGAAAPTMLSLPGFVGQVPSYRGIPILRNDTILQNEAKGASTALTSIYLISLSTANGFYAGCGGGKAFSVEADPRDRVVMGFHVERIGVLEGKDASRNRLKWYGGFALKSPLAAVRATEISTS
jgi:hypothetical protein